MQVLLPLICLYTSQIDIWQVTYTLKVCQQKKQTERVVVSSRIPLHLQRKVSSPPSHSNILSKTYHVLYIYICMYIYLHQRMRLARGERTCLVKVCVKVKPAKRHLIVCEPVEPYVYTTRSVMPQQQTDYIENNSVVEIVSGNRRQKPPIATAVQSLTAGLRWLRLEACVDRWAAHGPSVRLRRTTERANAWRPARNRPRRLWSRWTY